MHESQTETALEACRRLNISRQTLYAYVSRGLVKIKPHSNDARKRLYLSSDIDQLLWRQKKSRSQHGVAQSTIDFGEPILRSKISKITQGQFFYRGRDAVKLSEGANLEDIFELLCETKISSYGTKQKSIYVSQNTKPYARFIDALAHEAKHNLCYGNRPYAFHLTNLMANNAIRGSSTNSHEPIHKRIASSWSPDPRAADLIRRALVLSADHELNASTYAARVCASAGANLSACLLTGVSTLSGSRHGGLTDLCINWMRDSASKRLSDISIDPNHPLPGFGHRLYPNGDPRTIAILNACPAPKSWTRIARHVTKQTGHYPTLDFGLATLEHQLKLPVGSGFSIFAVARTVGWLAHCFEQRKSGHLIRPRAYE